MFDKYVLKLEQLHFVFWTNPYFSFLIDQGDWEEGDVIIFLLCRAGHGQQWERATSININITTRTTTTLILIQNNNNNNKNNKGDMDSHGNII